MTKPPALPTLPGAALAVATGGASRSSSSSSSSTDLQLQQTVQSITDSLRDLKNQNQSPLQQALPLLMVAKVMRDRG